MSVKYIDKPSPPVCWHVLGQDLVNALWSEGKTVREAAKRVLETTTVADITTKENCIALRDLIDAIKGSEPSEQATAESIKETAI